jgi:hypothetical protein
MATVTTTPIRTFVSGETVTPAKLNELSTPTISVSSIVNADIDASAAIAASKLALTGAIGATQLGTGAITDQTALDALANADSLLIHDDSTSALRKVTWSQIVAAAQPVGSVVGSDYAELVGEQTYTGSTLAIATTNPTVSDGHQLLSKSYAASNSSNSIIISTSVQLDGSAGPVYVGLFVFAGSTLIASRHLYDSYLPAQTIIIKHAPNSTSSVTYSVRAAVNSGNLFVNKAYGNSPYVTGKNISSMFIQEIKG